MGFQNVTIVGNLGKDPELRKTQKGIAVASFTVAVNEKRGDAESVTWFSCVAWEKAAEVVCDYLKKGDQALFQGRIATRVYEKEGREVPVWELVVNQVTFLGKRDDKGDGDRDDRRSRDRSDEDRRGSRDRDRDDRRGRDDDRRSGRGGDDWGDDKPSTGRRRSTREDLDDEIPF